MPYLIFILAAAAMHDPSLAPAPVAEFPGTRIGEIATGLALLVSGADIAARFIWPARNH